MGISWSQRARYTKLWFRSSGFRALLGCSDSAHPAAIRCATLVLSTHNLKMSGTLRIKPLVFTDRLLQAVQACPCQFFTVTRKGVQLWQIRDGECVLLNQRQLEHPLLLMLPPQTLDHTTANLLIGASQPDTGAWGCRIVWMSQTGLVDHDVALNTPESQYHGGIYSREPYPSCCTTICPPATSGLTMGAVSVYKGCVHAFGISGEPDRSKQAVTPKIHDFMAADSYQEGEFSIHAMAFMPAAPSDKTLFLVCLVSYTGFDHSQKQLHCLAVHCTSKGHAMALKITEGTWTVRNVDPSMTILQHVTALQCTEPGIVSVSSSSICLHPATAVKVNRKASAPVSSLELCSVELAGIPTAFQHLQGFTWALADTMAELWIVDLGDAHRLRKVTADIPLTLAHFICLASDPEADADSPVQLFLGSRTDTSQLLSIPRALIQCQAQHAGASQHAHPAEGSSQQLLEADSVHRLPAFDCAAPIHDAFVFQDPPGCGECRLMMGCGVAPRGSLKLAHLAAKLTPSISGGPHMPGGPKLMAVKAAWQQQHHAYLAFSFPLEGVTSVLDIQGTHFQPVSLPGLDPNCPTLLLAALPGGWMVQVTDQEVRVLSSDGLVGTWNPPDFVGIATSCGSLLALVHSSAVTVIRIQDTTGQVDSLQTLHFPQQVSAIAILEAPEGMSQEWQDTLLAVGLWAEDTLLLQRLSGGDPTCRLDCADVGQPRSMVAVEMHGTDFLFVGTSQGWVVYHPITWGSSGAGAGEVTLGAGVKVHAGISATQLSVLPPHEATPACVYAQSTKALLLRPSASTQASGDVLGLVEAVRVHGGEGVSGSVGVHTPDLPHSLAWLSPGNRLTFGEVDHTTHLRWFTLGLEDTPQHVAYHAASGHAAVLSNSPSGACWLRLVHAASLTQVVALQLGSGHKAAALCTVRLPSSSVSALHRLPGQPAPEKEFIVVSSYLEAAQGPSPGLGRPQGLLSVFEVCPAGSAAGRLHLKLHGSCKLDSPCYSLATAPAHVEVAATTFGDRHNDAGPQVVLAGCEGEVRMYSLFVDDSAQAGQQAVATARQALAQGEPLPQVSQVGSSTQAGTGTMAGSRKQLASQGWTDRVRLQVISKAKTPGGSSLVTSLSTLDNTVLACSFMLSLSLFTTRTQQGRAGLEALAANICLLDSSGQVHHDGPIQVQAAGILDGQCLVAGAYPDGLLLLERDPAQEMASCEARQQERDKKRHEDNALGNTASAADHNPQPCDKDDDIPELQLKAGCNIQQGATKFLRASLGVRRLPHPMHAAAAHEACGSCSGAQQVDTPDNQMLVTTSDGQVLAVSMTDADPQSQQFEVKSSHVEVQRAKWVSSMSASGALRLEPLAVDDCILVT